MTSWSSPGGLESPDLWSWHLGEIYTRSVMRPHFLNPYDPAFVSEGLASTHGTDSCHSLNKHSPWGYRHHELKGRKRRRMLDCWDDHTSSSVCTMHFVASSCYFLPLQVLDTIIELEPPVGLQSKSLIFLLERISAGYHQAT